MEINLAVIVSLFMKTKVKHGYNQLRIYAHLYLEKAYECPQFSTETFVLLYHKFNCIKAPGF